MPLYVLPGLGADERLFATQRAVREIRAIDRIPPLSPREPLTEYASRLARTLSLPPDFELAGASFGGMLALELARHVTPRRLWLFGSCRSRESIAPLLRMFRRVPFVHPPRITIPLLARYFGATSPKDVALFRDMLAATPRAYAAWAIHAIFTWPGTTDLAVPVTHVHGARDRVIPLSRVRADHVIAGAGHLLTMTHGGEVNAILETTRSGT